MNNSYNQYHNFTVRIVLRQITEEDLTKGIYDVLHNQMEDLGFKRSITLNNKTYKLPDAEYAISYPTDCGDVMVHANNAILSLFEVFPRYMDSKDQHYSILVTGADTYSCLNLDEIITV